MSQDDPGRNDPAIVKLRAYAARLRARLKLQWSDADYKRIQAVDAEVERIYRRFYTTVSRDTL